MHINLELSSRSKAIVVMVVVLFTVLIAAVGVYKRFSGLFETEKILYTTDDYGYSTHKYESIFLRTDRRVYGEGDTMIGTLVNFSPHAIEVKRGEPEIYELTGFGWLPPMGTIHTMQVYPSAYDEDRVEPGDVLPLDLSFLAVKSPPEGPPCWRMLEQPYSYDGDEYVVYSNEILLTESGQPPRFRRPPEDITEVPSVQVEIVEPYVVALKNDTKLALWFNPLCSDVEVDVGHTAYPYYPVLQRQSGEGTWQVLRSDKERCTTVKEPIRIGPGKTVQLFVGDGYPAPDELEPGVYRWHLVSFMDPFPDCNCWPDCCFLSGAHLFTQTFEP